MAASFSKPSLASSLLRLSEVRPAAWGSLSTSCKPVDDVLMGGFPYGSITTISGSHPPSRTLIALHTFSSHILSDPTTEAIWVDTTGNFPGETLKEIIFATSPSQEVATSLLERAKITRVFDLQGLVETIDEIRDDHRTRQRESNVVPDSEGESEDEEGDGGREVPYERTKRGVRLVVVDNVTLLYATMVNKSQLQGQAMLVEVLRSFAVLVKTYGIAVLLLNDTPHTTTPPDTPNFHPRFAFKHSTLPSVFADSSLRFLNGSTFSYGADLHILLSRHPYEPNEERYGRRGARSTVDEGTVFEIVADRIGGRTGRWTAFGILGNELVALS